MQVGGTGDRHGRAADVAPGRAARSGAKPYHEVGRHGAVAVDPERAAVLDGQRAGAGEISAGAEANGVARRDDRAGHVLGAADDVDTAAEIDVGKVIDSAGVIKIAAAEVESARNVKCRARKVVEARSARAGQCNGLAAINIYHAAAQIIEVTCANLEARAEVSIYGASIAECAADGARRTGAGIDIEYTGAGIGNRVA